MPNEYHVPHAQSPRRIFWTILLFGFCQPQDYPPRAKHATGLSQAKARAMQRTTFQQTMLFKIVVVTPLVVCGLAFLQADPGERVSPHSRRLLEAVRTNDVLTAATLLERGVDPDAQAADGTTALVLAIQRDALGMAKLLIDSGANVNLAAQDDVTPLALAIKLDKPQIARLLLDAGANVDLPTADGQTRLVAFAKSDEMRAVLSATADPAAR
jgi:hypothetical protein